MTSELSRSCDKRKLREVSNYWASLTVGRTQYMHMCTVHTRIHLETQTHTHKKKCFLG